MARSAAADDIGVVESGTQKTARSSVAILAGCGSCNMPARFAGGDCAVMACGAAIADAIVIERRTEEAGGALVASLAGGSGQNMRGGFPFCFGAVVT